MADNHVKQQNAILFARDTIGAALVHFITMLTDWTGRVHSVLSVSKVYALDGQDDRWQTLLQERISSRSVCIESGTQVTPGMCYK